MRVYNYRRKKRFNETQEKEMSNEKLVTQSAAPLRNYVFIERPVPQFVPLKCLMKDLS